MELAKEIILFFSGYGVSFDSGLMLSTALGGS